MAGPEHHKLKNLIPWEISLHIYTIIILNDAITIFYIIMAPLYAGLQRVMKKDISLLH